METTNWNLASTVFNALRFATLHQYQFRVATQTRMRIMVDGMTHIISDRRVRAWGTFVHAQVLMESVNQNCSSTIKQRFGCSSTHEQRFG